MKGSELENNFPVEHYLDRARLSREIGRMNQAARYYEVLGKYFFVAGDRERSWHFFEEKQKVLECARARPASGVER
ncbi:MAG: hypothetical protein ACTSU5_15765 [Promethearchaeota archaeon]